ncbi:MAG: YlcI/YnfO family protein [Candidatus Aphodomorpha sp.]
MPASKAQQRAVAKYMRANYDAIQLRIPKGARDEIRKHAEQQGESVNAFVQRAIREQIQRDGGQHGGQGQQ